MIWTPQKDALLINLIDKRGMSRAEAAAFIGGGCTRNMVIGRYHRAKGNRFESDVHRNTTAKNRTAEIRKRREERRKKIVETLKADLAAGTDRNVAIRRAYRSGAMLVEIAPVIGIGPNGIVSVIARGRLYRNQKSQVTDDRSNVRSREIEVA